LWYGKSRYSFICRPKEGYDGTAIIVEDTKSTCAGVAGAASLNAGINDSTARSVSKINRVTIALDVGASIRSLDLYDKPSPYTKCSILLLDTAFKYPTIEETLSKP
jgi:hypothetical protein